MPIALYTYKIDVFTARPNGDAMIPRSSCNKPQDFLTVFWGDDMDEGSDEEWADINRNALSSSAIDEIAQYLLETGQGDIARSCG